MLLRHQHPIARSLRTGDHILGPALAPVILLEYGCYCSPREAQLHDAVHHVLECFPEQVAYVFRHFPLIVNYPCAFDAAELVEACAACGRFWDMHNYLAANARNYSREALLQAAADLDFDAAALAKALDAHIYGDLVKEHFHSGVRSGVRRAPILFVNGRPLPPDVTASNLRDIVARSSSQMHGICL